MDQDNQLAQALFAVMAALLEDAHDIAVMGQAKGVKASDHRRMAHRLGQAAREVEAVAVTAQVILRQDGDAAA